MNWSQAIAAMKRGAHVHRASEQKRERIGDSGGIPVYDCGTEDMRLAAAWSVEGAPVMVFQGVGSKALFVPEAEDMEATDWEIASD